MYSRIVIPVDVSYDDCTWLEAPFRVAVEFSRKTVGKIHLVSVVPENLLKGFYPDIHAAEVAKSATEKLHSIRDTMLPNDVPVELSVPEGGICTEILQYAEHINADLIVTASHGPLVRDYLLGSNAAYLALHARCSVFVVRN